MTLENLYRMSKLIDGFVGKNVKSEMIIYLDKKTHDSLQEEVYRTEFKTLQGYKPDRIFDIIIYNTKYTFKTID